jgi:hypothetical protein
LQFHHCPPGKNRQNHSQPKNQNDHENKFSRTSGKLSIVEGSWNSASSGVPIIMNRWGRFNASSPNTASSSGSLPIRIKESDQRVEKEGIWSGLPLTRPMNFWRPIGTFVRSCKRCFNSVIVLADSKASV